MTRIWIDAENLKLLNRALWTNTKVVAAFMTLIFAGGFQGSRSGDHGAISAPQAQIASYSEEQVESMRSVPPSGWRRTNRGWEHTSNWTMPNHFGANRSISELIATQQASEPKWLQLVLSTVRRIPPLMIAAIQVTAVAILMLSHRGHRIDAPSQ
ncbi:hypothetical protein Q31b_30430 [Novipirellula aureliae]|uniref:Uncharacterized protein n=1 Tax=Novipirellula aureliae TaxID=2527966 RepID=A0A5C6DYC4_9BACT|nr:hypothetical protein [Novipirellula aureliae]TWU41592.1 hypothetical protein Q31b_30430 [Novipirellula aureliae]